MEKKFLTALTTGEALYEGDKINVYGYESPNDLEPEHNIALGIKIDENGFVQVVHKHGADLIESIIKIGDHAFKDADHVDAFVDYTYGKHQYARFVLYLKRLPATLRLDFKDLIEPFKLYCKYQDQWRVVTGASRLGDVWLNEDLDKTVGYTERVSVLQCSCWTGTRPT